MKILYAVFKNEYSDPSRGYSFEHYNFYDTLTKMDGGRHEVVYFPYDEIMVRDGRDAMNQKLEEMVDREQPDITFFVLFTEEFKKEVLKRISDSGKTKTVVWMTDDHWRFDNYSRYWAECFNWVLTTDSLAVKKYHAIGYQNVIKSQWACNHFLYKPPAMGVTNDVQQIADNKFQKKIDVPSVVYEHDVSFVGQPHGNRKVVIEKLRKAGLRVDCFGFGWPDGKLSQEQMIRVFGTSKINLNLGNASVGIHSLKGFAHLFLKRSGRLFVPQGPRDMARNVVMALAGVREQIKGRNFEVPGCGGFLLTSKADNLESYYEIGREVVVFRDSNDLIEKAKYYLAHDAEREAVARAGYQRTLRDHTYEKRFRDIFKEIGAYE